MRILITGGAGFIGSNFVRRLLLGAYPWFGRFEVVVLDKLTYAGNLANLAPVIDDPRLDFVRGDLCDTGLVDKVMRGVNTVVHFAAESHVDRSIDGGLAFVTTNIVGGYVLFDAARRHGADACVAVSTDEVYGSIDSGSWPEDHPLDPTSPYSASKASSDLLALSLHRTHGAPVTIVRSSNNYGPYQYPEKVIPLFVTNLLDGRKVPLYGDGGNVREWTHVDDHCRGIALAAHKGRAGEVYNIGSGHTLSNLELTDALLRLTGNDRSMVEPVADRKGHDRRYSVDFGKITAELGYRPEIPFADGLAGTVQWYAENRAWWEPLRRATV
ncbi:dTDP-glucose 4,6-dehydratase [Sphaerisporangium dianthi]|uniref:dTDP-glucose 4,6-dehydratase n=1 Tax=Sphaerisporangium dianthi TaxID=1436120 RepID=A0ABV9CTK6_9ACTN